MQFLSSCPRSPTSLLIARDSIVPLSASDLKRDADVSAFPRIALRCLLALALLAAFTVTDFAAPQEEFVIGRGRVGSLKIGMAADEVVALFGQQRVTKVDLHLEGIRSPALEIRLGELSAQQPTLRAELLPPTENIVYRVSVFDRRFKTAEGLGVGSTLNQIELRHHARILVGEGNVVAYVQELEVSFDFGLRGYPTTHLPGSARVRSVWVLSPLKELRR